MKRSRGYKKYQSNDARNRKELKRIELKLRGYLNAFISICYFDEKKLDWNIITEEEFKKLKRKWMDMCIKKGYGDEIKDAFWQECLLIKTDLIIQVKYKKKEVNRTLLMEQIAKGVQPLQVAKFAMKQFKLEKV